MTDANGYFQILMYYSFAQLLYKNQVFIVRQLRTSSQLVAWLLISCIGFLLVTSLETGYQLYTKTFIWLVLKLKIQHAPPRILLTALLSFLQDCPGCESDCESIVQNQFVILCAAINEELSGRWLLLNQMIGKATFQLNSLNRMVYRDKILDNFQSV